MSVLDPDNLEIYEEAAAKFIEMAARIRGGKMVASVSAAECTPLVVELICRIPCLSDVQLQAIADAVSSVERSRKAETIRPSSQERVYFVLNPISALIKIGYSRNVETRLQTIRLDEELSHPLTVLKVTPGGREVERSFHTKFHSYRVRGEWFSPHQELYDLIQTLPDAPWKTERRPRVIVPQTIPLFVENGAA